MLAATSTARHWIALAALLVPAAMTAEDWTRFRGPNGTGVASAPGLPIEWTAKDHAWETLLPGVGHSSPVVSRGRLYVTTASEDGTSRQIVCLDAKGGKIVWTRSLALHADKLHAKNSYASGTPVVTDDLVVTTFADDERHVVAAFDLDGTPAWTYDLGPFESQHGHGASPIAWQDLVIVPNDQEGMNATSTIVALDVRSGEHVWTAPRPTGDASYSTPFILESEGQAPQLIASSNTLGVTSLDPSTGSLNWKSGALPKRTVGSPVFAGGLIFQSCGQAGRGVLLVGVDPFAASDKGRVVFEEQKILPYVPTPVAYEDHLYLWNDNGVVVCLDLDTRKPVWTERVSGNFSASPICVNGLLYAVSEEGEVAVVRASPKFEEPLGRSLLGDRSHATPAVADGKMFFRTFHKVICLAPRGAS